MPQHFCPNLFVYGSLRSGFKSPAYDYISKYFSLTGEAHVRGQLFDLGEYPAAVPVDTDHFIVGELYSTRNANELSYAIAQLDDYEGVAVEAHETPLYRRELVKVHHGDNVVDAWVYWYNGDVSGKPAIDSGDVLSYLKNK